MAKPRKTKRTGISPDDPALTYAQGVLAGEIIAGPHVRAAAQRFISDLETAPARGYHYDPERADRLSGFFRDVLCLNGGEYEGVPFILQGWQEFIVRNIGGWVSSKTGYRRFRTAYIETGKGSGKSPLAAGIGLYGLVADGEPRAECYAAATKRDQAQILFRDAVVMVDYSKALQTVITKSGTGEKTWNLAYTSPVTGALSFFRTLSSDQGQSGPRPHIGLADEVHEHRDNSVVEMLKAGQKNRRQPLVIMITNSGAGLETPCWHYHTYAAHVAAGILEDDEHFGYVCALDPEDDPFKDEACWPKANPSLQHANLPGYDYLRRQVKEAANMPSKKALVMRLNFCTWTDAENPWISPGVWNAAAQDYDLEALRGRRAWGGLDLSSTTDLTGFSLLVEPKTPGEPWKTLAWAWLPAIGLGDKAEKDKVPYLAWREMGWLKTTEGAAIDKVEVCRYISHLASILKIQEIAYDRWRIEDLKQSVLREGIALPPLVPHGQGYKDMAPAIDALETALLNGEVAHNKNPILRWCAANAVVIQDDAGNRKLSKDRSTGRIDLMVATTMAAGAALIKKEAPKPALRIFV